MKSAIVKAHSAGLFSLVNNLITCLDKYDYVSVDWTGSIYGEGDLWPGLFENNRILSKVTIGSVQPSEVVEGYQDQWLTYKNAGQLYLSGDEWRIKCHDLWGKLRVRQEIWLNVFRFPMLNQFRGKTVAVLIRAHGHAGEQLSGKSQTLEQYAEAIQAEKPDHLYIACQDIATLGWFEGTLSSMSNLYYPANQFHYHPYAKRSPSRDIDRHLVEPQTHRDAIVVLEEALIMSQCDVLVHPVSNISTAVLYMNPKVKSVFLQ